jgi:disulfide bond formation protein DsbB
MRNVTEFVAHNDALVALGIVASIICFIALRVGAGSRAGRFLLTVPTNGWTSARSQWRRALVTQARRCGESATYFIAFSMRQVMLIFLLGLTGVINAAILTAAKQDPAFAVTSWPSVRR